MIFSKYRAPWSSASVGIFRMYVGNPYLPRVGANCCRIAQREAHGPAHSTSSFVPVWNLFFLPDFIFSFLLYPFSSVPFSFPFLRFEVYFTYFKKCSEISEKIKFSKTVCNFEGMFFKSQPYCVFL